MKFTIPKRINLFWMEYDELESIGFNLESYSKLDLTDSQKYKLQRINGLLRKAAVMMHGLINEINLKV